MKKPSTISPQEKPTKQEAPVKHLINNQDKALLDLLADIFTKQIMKNNPLTLDKTNSK